MEIMPAYKIGPACARRIPPLW